MCQKVSKNTNYSQYVHTFFGHNSAIFQQIGLKIFMVTQESIIYRLVIKNFGFGPSSVGPKKGVAPQILIWVRDLKTQSKR